jgi:phage tail-like protein
MAAYEDAPVGFHYALDLQGKVVGYFIGCSGMGSEHDIVEHKVVNEKGKEVMIKLPGRLKWENIVMKKGITTDFKIWEWRKQVENGQVAKARCEGSIILYDYSGDKIVARWDFKGAWPSKVTTPEFKADSNEIALEELTITHEYIERIQ